MKNKFKFLALLVAFSLVTGVASAAVKAGAACSKLGATSAYSGKKYTCIKSGKKLVWNKGVAVAKPAPTVFPTPESSPSVSPTPTPTPLLTPFVDQNKGYLRNGQFVYRVIDDILQRRIYGTSDYTAEDTRADSDFDAIRVKAYKEIWGLKRIAGHPNLEIMYSISENYPKAHADTVKRGVVFF